MVTYKETRPSLVECTKMLSYIDFGPLYRLQ